MWHHSNCCSDSSFKPIGWIIAFLQKLFRNLHRIRWRYSKFWIFDTLLHCLLNHAHRNIVDDYMCFTAPIICLKYRHERQKSASPFSR